MMTVQRAAKQILNILLDPPDSAAKQLSVGSILEAYFAAVGSADQFGEGLHWLIQHGYLEETPAGYRLTSQGRTAKI